MGHDITSGSAAILKKIEKSGWVILSALCAGALLASSFPYALGIAVGGVLGLANFWGMDVYFNLIFGIEIPRIKWWHHALYGTRFIALLVAIAAAIGWAHLPVIGIVVGLSAPLAGIVSYGAFALIKREAAVRA